MLRIEHMDMLQMIVIDGAKTWTALSFISGAVASWRSGIEATSLSRSPGNLAISLPPGDRAQFVACCKWLAETAKALNMAATADAASRAIRECPDLLAAPVIYDTKQLMQVVTCGDRLIHAFNAELRDRIVMTMDSRHAAFFSAAEPFGSRVADAFPSAAFDITEAAKCRALARWTASVMHLMRVLEVGLIALARHYGVASDSNWNQMLNQIEAKTREVSKKTHGELAEQRAAEAATHLRFVKNAWRNHAMHARQTYDEERAVTIFDGARSFMQNLAEWLSEDDTFL